MRKIRVPQLVAWNVTASICIVLPILFYLAVKAFTPNNANNEGDAEDANNENAKEWGWGINQGKVLCIVSYLWVLMLFIGIVGFGNAVLQEEQDEIKCCLRLRKGQSTGDKSMGVLTGALIMFANFSFLLAIILSCLLLDFSQFGASFLRTAMLVPFSFFIWAAFCSVNAFIFIRNQGRLLTSDQRLDVSTKAKKTKESSSERRTTRDREMTTDDMANNNANGEERKKGFCLFSKKSKCPSCKKAVCADCSSSPLV